MVYLILLIISLVSLAGILFMAISKIPALLLLPETSKPVRSKKQEQAEAIIDVSEASIEKTQVASPWFFEQRFREHLKKAQFKMANLRDRDPHQIDQDHNYWSRIVASKIKKRASKKIPEVKSDSPKEGTDV